MAKTIQVNITKDKNYHFQWPKNALKRVLPRLLSDAFLPAGVYLYVLFHIGQPVTGRKTEIKAVPIEPGLLHLNLNLQVNGEVCYGQLTLPSNARSPRFLQQLQDTARLLDESGWVRAKQSEVVETGVNEESHPSVKTAAKARLHAYLPKTSTVVDPVQVAETAGVAKVDLIIGWAKQIDSMLAGWQQHLTQVTTFEKREFDAFVAGLARLRPFLDSGTYLEAERDDSTSGLIAGAKSYRRYHQEKVAFIRQQIKSLQKLKDSLVDGSWKQKTD